MSNSRGPESLGETVRELGSKASAGTHADAAQAREYFATKNHA